MRNAARKLNAGADPGNIVCIAQGPPVPLRETRRKRLQSALLAAYAECGNIHEAARCARTGRQSHYDWLKTDPEYVRRFEESKEEAADVLLSEARRRVFEGHEEPVDPKNPAAGAVRRYSSEMLMFLLKAMKPEVYREHFRAGTVAVAGRVLDLRRLNGDQLREIEAIIRKQDQALQANKGCPESGTSSIKL